MNVLIGTPCYGGKLDLDYLNTIIDCNRLRLPVSVMGLRNESLITRGRNTILSYFLSMKDFTHLLFLDADIGISGDDIAKLLTSGKDVVGAPVRLKGEPPVFNCPPAQFYGGKTNGLLQETERIGTAVLLLSRHACETVASEAPTYRGNPLTRGVALDIPHYDVFRCGVKDGVYLSEDYWACSELRRLGFAIWCDWSIKTRHWGNDCYAS
jgi:hypothetical protein